MSHDDGYLQDVDSTRRKRNYLNCNLLTDESEPPAYSGPLQQKLLPHRPPEREYHERSPIPDHVPSAEQAPAQPRENVHDRWAPVRPRARRLVTAIDFGTTFSGVATVTTDSHRVNVADIRVIQNWNQRMSNLEKVPSVKSYSQPLQEEEQWGSDISENATTMVNQKLELELQDNVINELDLTLYVLGGTGYLSFDHVREAGSDPEFTYKTPEGVVSDYLTHLFKCVHKEIDVAQIETTRTTVDLVVTVPVPWTYHGYNSLFKAISKAGFNTTNLPTLTDMMLVTEPEAAALFTAQDLKDHGTEFLQEDHCFILCDAGDGTVDAVAYQVKRLKPFLELERATEPTGCNRGSAFIDTEFKLWLRDTVLGRDRYPVLDPANASQKRISPHTAETAATRLLIKRFSSHKVVFSNGNRTPIKIDLPPPFDQLTHDRVNHGELTITWDEMKSLMDKCVNPVVELIRAQIHEASILNGRRVKNVFLVGGFGASPYLQEELRDCLDIMKKKLRRPDAAKSLTAVVQGGVIYGCDKGRRIHEAYHQELRCRHRCSLPVRMADKKGDLMLSNQVVPLESRTFWEPTWKTDGWKFGVYSYDDDDDLPEDWETSQREVKTIGIVDVDFSGYGTETEIGPLKWRFMLSDRLLQAELLLEGSRVGRCEVELMDQSGSGSVRRSIDS